MLLCTVRLYVSAAGGMRGGGGGEGRVVVLKFALGSPQRLFKGLGLGLGL